MRFLPYCSNNITNTIHEIEASQVLELTNDKTILYLNYEDVASNILHPVVLQLQVCNGPEN